MQEAGLLDKQECKPAVKMFIRNASEVGMWSLNAHYRSVEAGEVIAGANIRTATDYQNFCRAKVNGLTHEHMVPGEVVYRLLVEHPMPSVAAFEEILRKTGFRAIITQGENSRLRRSTMPPAFHDPTSPMYFSHRARYDEVDPPIELQPRPVDGWFKSQPRQRKRA